MSIEQIFSEKTKDKKYDIKDIKET